MKAIVLALFVATLGASAWPTTPRTRTVVLTIRHSHFSPSTINATKGERIRFVVRNTDPIDHELIVGPWPVQLRHEAGRRTWHPPVPGEVSVRLGSRASTTYTFNEKGAVLFGCHLPGHWAYGMQGRIVVT